MPNGKRSDIAVFHRPDSLLHQVIIPTDPTLADFSETVIEAVRKLAEFEKRPAQEILNYLLLPPSDILSFREISADAEDGSIPLDRAVRMIDGARKLLLSGAHSVLAPQPYHPRMSRSEAEDFVSRCRLGPTDRGRFVLSVACPLDLKADLLGLGGEPFARRVTALLMQSLDDLSRAADAMQIAELVDTARHPGISANLCEALLLLRPGGERARLEVSASWSRAFLPEGREGLCEISLRQEVFDVAEVLAPRLRSVPEPRVDRFVGFVDELRGQPSRDDARPSGEVRFTLFDQGEDIRARADLNAEEYARAGAAHLAGAVVSFKGILQRLPRLNRINEVIDFQIVDFDDGIPHGANAKDQPRPPIAV